MAYAARIQNGIFQWVNTSTGLVESPAANVIAETNDVAAAIFLTRANTTAYTTVSLIKIDLGATDQIWQCTTAGTSHSSAPTFPTDAVVGATVAEGAGTVVWTLVGILTEAASIKTTKYFTTGEKLHRTNGAAFLRNVDGVNQTQAWFREGELHRIDGPAVIVKNPADAVVIEDIYVSGRKIDKDSFWLATHLGTNGVTAGLTLTNPYAGYTTDAQLIAAFDTLQSRIVSG